MIEIWQRCKIISKTSVVPYPYQIPSAARGARRTSRPWSRSTTTRTPSESSSSRRTTPASPRRSVSNSFPPSSTLRRATRASTKVSDNCENRFCWRHFILVNYHSGDPSEEGELLTWLLYQMKEDTIENINRDLLFKMIAEEEFLGVFFCEHQSYFPFQD